MGLFKWIYRVVTDTGSASPVPVHLERGSSSRSYTFALGVRAGPDGTETARVPVDCRTNPDRHPILKEIYSCEVMGRRLEAANVYALKAKVAAQLETIAPARRLPVCYFRVPANDYEIPVYEHGGQFVSGLLGGPHLKASDLGGIYRGVCRYLESAGYIASRSDVTVGVLKTSDLSRVEPAGIFRSLQDPALWLPAIDGISDTGSVIGLIDGTNRPNGHAKHRLTAPEQGTAVGSDLLTLLGALQTDAGRNGSQLDPESVYASDVRYDIWQQNADSAHMTDTELVCYLGEPHRSELRLPIYRTAQDQVAVALEDRNINVFLGANEKSLASSVGRYLHAHSFLHFYEQVEVQTGGHTPAPNLDPDDVWLGSNGSWAGEAPPLTEAQEVKT
jgi:hypothetical protein